MDMRGDDRVRPDICRTQYVRIFNTSEYSKSAIDMAQNPVNHKRSKHIQSKYH